MKVTDSVTEPGHGPVFICDFSPPRGADPELLSGARRLAAADFICVAYNPGKLVRLDSVAAARHLKQSTGRDVIFNLSPRDMNRIALESKLLGAHLMGLENVLVVQGDHFNQQDGLRAADDYTATELIAAVKRLNQGLDYRDSKLRSATDLCPGAGLDLNRDLADEVHLTHRKIEAGAEFLVSQPVFDVALVADFVAQYAAETGQPLRVPVFWGIQVLARDSVLFSNVPEDFLRDLENGRDGVDIALQTYALLREQGINTVYVVSPILRGGTRDYEAGGRLLREAAASRED
jgi:methionine synthase / methylenetetrahydrofolate reductase(NADPH)